MATYSASLNFLYGLQKHGVKLGLETITALLERLGHPQHRYPALHVGGTNGKGSTAAMAASVLQAAGYRIGLYTSPHLIDFTERMRVDGRAISGDGAADLVDRVRAAMGEGLEPTFFEFTTAMAFQHFADEAVDIAVIEVGMGGRFDATNVIVPWVSAITNVALDHQAYLGGTVPAIAYEKAGIIKPLVPVVLGRMAAEAAHVIEALARDHAAPCYRLSTEFSAEGDTLDGFRYEGIAASYRNLSCPLPGAHQVDNAACALAMVELASQRGRRMSEDAVRAGLRAVQWEGRLEIVERHPLLVLDGAHNPAAAEAVTEYLARYRSRHPVSRVIAVVSLMRDKDRDGFLRVLRPHVNDLILTQAKIPRAASVEELCGSLGPSSRQAHVAPGPVEALALARRLARPDDLICVTGSLMLVGDVKALLSGCELSSLRG